MHRISINTIINGPFGVNDKNKKDIEQMMIEEVIMKVFYPMGLKSNQYLFIKSQIEGNKVELIFDLELLPEELTNLEKVTVHATN